MEIKMQKIYNTNSLVHWNEEEIEQREHFTKYFAREVKQFLLDENPAWMFNRIEAPMMIPKSLINENYTNEDLWCLEEDLVLKPETTPSTYAWMLEQMKHKQIKMPWCVWQASKSFRKEKDHVLSHMRLKEFYQQEFQCAYTEDTMNDYQEKSLEIVRKMINSQFSCFKTRIVESDRLPDYSLRTMDIEVELPTDDNKTRWMELCSISKRKDFPVKYSFYNKKNELVEKNILVLEIAIGLDRCLFAHNLMKEKM